MRARCSLETEPWWARASTGAAPSLRPDCAMTSAGTSPGRRATTSPGSGSTPARSAAISLSRAVSRSERRRELAKTMVERWASMRSATRSSTCGQRLLSRPPPSESLSSSRSWTPPGLVMSSTGTTTESSHSLLEGGATISTGALPPRNRATSSSGRTVAERPMRWAGESSIASRRSRLSARWAPRLVPATACTSSMITVRTPRSDSRAWLVSMRNSDSGVVMRMSGGLVESRRRSAALVSPERTPTCTSETLVSSRSAVWRMPVSGARRLRSTSTARAFSGLTYRTRQRSWGSSGGVPVSTWSSDQRKALSVLPLPVGATTSACFPAPMACQAPTWAGVGSAKAARNHVRVGSLNSSSTSAPLLTRSSCPMAPTVLSPDRVGRPEKVRACLVGGVARARRRRTPRRAHGYAPGRTRRCCRRSDR